MLCGATYESKYAVLELLNHRPQNESLDIKNRQRRALRNLQKSVLEAVEIIKMLRVIQECSALGMVETVK